LHHGKRDRGPSVAPPGHPARLVMAVFWVIVALAAVVAIIWALRNI
jgi:hypothetical protein